MNYLLIASRGKPYIRLKGGFRACTVNQLIGFTFFAEQFTQFF